MIAVMVALARNGAIGKDNGLLWHISADLKRFKALTGGHTVLMGRRTYDSLPKKPLPNRKHLILTSDAGYPVPEGGLRLSDVEACKAYFEAHPDEDIFIMGGGQVYQQLLPYADQLYLTEVQADFEADTFFPPIDAAQWRVVEEGAWTLDENSGLTYRFVDYKQIR
ncbi:MAG: dihydrofolate reductase [Bacteroidales bacterium]|nr:dihydrofolate reductase [Bacteroidales bacterium]